MKNLKIRKGGKMIKKARGEMITRKFLPLNDGQKTGIYCHIPFCVKKCAYCDFNSRACQDENTIDRYFQALKKEILLFSPNQKIAVDSIYFGGGTPSAVAASKIKDLMTVFKNEFALSKESEITIEVNPGTITEKKLLVYKEAGINRISIGFQAWQDELLRLLGRVHDQKDFIRGIESVKKAGFSNISVDLMYGIPSQTLAMVEESLSALVCLGATHFSCYSLILEADTPLTKKVQAGLLTLPAEEEERQMHWLIDRFLEKNKYHHYEISSFAKATYASRHNLKYWQMAPYLGFGLGAHGFYQGIRYGNEGNYKRYMALLESGQDPRQKEPPLSKRQWMNDWMLLGLRKVEGLDSRHFQRIFHEDFFKVYEKEIAGLIARKLLIQEDYHLRLTRHGQDFANQVFGAFI